MPYFAYILKSNHLRAYYKGHCEDLEKRITEHNTGKTKSTKHGIPWQIVNFEEFDTRHEAILRERYFKTAAGRRFLKTKLNLF